MAEIADGRDNVVGGASWPPHEGEAPAPASAPASAPAPAAPAAAAPVKRTMVPAKGGLLAEADAPRYAALRPEDKILFDRGIFSLEELEDQVDDTGKPVPPLQVIDGKLQYALKVPDFIPMSEVTPEREAAIAEFGQLSPEMGITPETSQAMLEAFTDAATHLEYVAPDEYTTTEDAFKAMIDNFGEEDARAIVSQAAEYVKSMPHAARQYLERTGLGNDIGVIYTLALAKAGVFSMSPAAAQKEIDSYMNDPESSYHSNDAKERRGAILEIQVLSRIASGKEVTLSQVIAKESKPKMVRTSIGTAKTDHAIAAEQSALRREAAELVPKLSKGSKQEMDAAKAKFMSITAKLK